jgi:hypothetical protein
MQQTMPRMHATQEIKVRIRMSGSERKHMRISVFSFLIQNGRMSISMGSARYKRNNVSIEYYKDRPHIIELSIN